MEELPQLPDIRDKIWLNSPQTGQTFRMICASHKERLRPRITHRGIFAFFRFGDNHRDTLT